jgi:hypothetical protein
MPWWSAWLAQASPQLDGVIVDRRALIVEIIGTNDRGITSGVAAAQPALFEDGHVANAVCEPHARIRAPVGSTGGSSNIRQARRSPTIVTSSDLLTIAALLAI